MAGELEVSKAVYARLAGFTALTDLLADGVSGVYGHVPQQATSGSAGFPYVAIGDTTSVAFDTDTTTGYDVTVTIHGFNRGRSPLDAFGIMGQVYSALHRHNLSVSGYNLIDCLWDDTAELLQEPDGFTYHTVQRFRITINE